MIFWLLCILLLLYTFLNFKKRFKLNYPPGPPGLPFVGYLPFLGKYPFKTFKDLSRKYGNVLGLRLGLTNVVVLNDYKTIKDAYRNPSILDRPSNLFDFHAGGLGFAATNGLEWVEERRHNMKILKDIGVGRARWEEIIDNEMKYFLEALSLYGGNPVDVYNILSSSIANNMMSLILGRRFSIDDEKLKTVMKAVDSISPLLNQSSMANFIPILSQLLVKLGLSNIQREIINTENFNKLLIEEVKIRNNQIDFNEEIFIDLYLKQMKEVKQKNTKYVLSEYNLVSSVQAITHGGSETIRTSLLWLFLAMASYPDIQRNTYEEIYQVLGKHSRCKWEDRNKLPYTYATMLEGQRWRTITPLGLSHKASQDTTLYDYFIPKGTYVIANMWAAHNDPNYWSKPEEFIPNRFLTVDGLLMKKYDSFMPFSSGRRKCPGESMAYIEIFKYFATLVQHFEILPLKNCAPNLLGNPETTYHPYPQMLRFVPRIQV